MKSGSFFLRCRYGYGNEWENAPTPKFTSTKQQVDGHGKICDTGTGVNGLALKSNNYI